MNLAAWLRTQWDLVAGWGLIALGGLVFLLGFRGVSNTPYVPEQLPYIMSGGIGGIILVAVGAVLLVTAELRDEWRKLAELQDLLDGSLDLRPSGPEPDSPTAQDRPSAVGAARTTPSAADDAALSRTSVALSSALAATGLVVTTLFWLRVLERPALDAGLQAASMAVFGCALVVVAIVGLAFVFQSRVRAARSLLATTLRGRAAGAAVPTRRGPGADGSSRGSHLKGCPLVDSADAGPCPACGS